MDVVEKFLDDVRLCAAGEEMVGRHWSFGAGSRWINPGWLCNLLDENGETVKDRNGYVVRIDARLPGPFPNLSYIKTKDPYNG